MPETPTERWEEFRNLPNQPELSVFPDRPPRISGQDEVDSEFEFEFEFECPKCKHDLRSLSGRYCPECGVSLEYEPVKVFGAADQSLVWVAKLLMDRHEVSNMIVVGGYDPFGGLYPTRSTLPHLLVPYKFFYEAVDLLEREFGGRSFKKGEAPAKPPSPPPWTCPACHEENPGSFDICWNCNHQPDVSEQEA